MSRVGNQPSLRRLREDTDLAPLTYFAVRSDFRTAGMGILEVLRQGQGAPQDIGADAIFDGQRFYDRSLIRLPSALCRTSERTTWCSTRTISAGSPQRLHRQESGDSLTPI